MAKLMNILNLFGLSKFENKEASKAIQTLSTCVFAVDILLKTELEGGLSKQDWAILTEAKSTILTEMGRLYYEPVEYELVVDAEKNSTVQIKLKQQTNETIDRVNECVIKMSQSEKHDLRFLYQLFLTETSGVRVSLLNVGELSVIELQTVLLFVTESVKTIALADLLATYSKPTKLNIVGEEQLYIENLNPFSTNVTQKGIFLIAPILNEYNAPLRLITLFETLLFILKDKYILQKNECNLKNVNFKSLHNKAFGQTIIWNI